MSETPTHNLLTVKETAEYLRIPLPTVYYLVQRGKIPAIQIGGRWRIKKSVLDHDILRIFAIGIMTQSAWLFYTPDHQEHQAIASPET